MSVFNTAWSNIEMTSCIATYVTIILTIHSIRDVFAACGQRILTPIYGQTRNPAQNATMHGLNHQQCTYQCLRRGSKCLSRSYNSVEKLCVVTATPCHELSPDRDVQTIVLHNLTHHWSKCLQWSPCEDPQPARSISYGTVLLARWRDLQGNLIIGYKDPYMGFHGYAYFRYITRTAVKPPFIGCDLITIADDCSVAWVPFAIAIGKPVPHNAVKTGFIMGHGPVYVGRFITGEYSQRYRFGYYMSGNPSLT